MGSKSDEHSALSSPAKVAKLSKCRNKGCEVILERDQLSEHVKTCEYRLIRVCHYLGFPGCLKDFRVEDLASHLKSVHNLPTVNINDEMQQFGLHGTQRHTDWPPVVLLSENCIPLVLKTKMNRHYMYWTISALHSHDKLKDLKAKIKLVTDAEQVHSVTWKGAIIKLRRDCFYREALCVPLCKMLRLKHWMLQVKLCSDTKGKTAEEIPQLDVEASPGPA